MSKGAARRSVNRITAFVEIVSPGGHLVCVEKAADENDDAAARDATVHKRHIPQGQIRTLPSVAGAQNITGYDTMLAMSSTMVAFFCHAV